MRQSATTGNLNKLSSSLGQSELKNSKNLQKSNLTTSQKPPKQVDFKQQDKKMDDEYVEKLHNHIQFLATEITKIKQQQSQYKDGLANMMSRDSKPIVEHAVDSTGKFKNMKQELIQIIHNEETNQMLLCNQAVGFVSQKEYLQNLLQELQQQHDDDSKIQQKNLEGLADQYSKQEEKRKEIDKEFEKWFTQNQQITNEYDKKKRDQNESNKIAEIEKKKFEELIQVEEADEAEKKQLIEQLKIANSKEKEKKDQDIRFQDLKQKNDEFKQEISKFEKERDHAFYKLKETEALVKLGGIEKEKEAEERKIKRQEVERYEEMLRTVMKNNQIKIEARLQNSESQNLRQVQKDLIATEKEQRELQQKCQQLEEQYKKFTIEMLHKTTFYENFVKENEQKELKLAKIQARYNDSKANYDKCMGENVEMEERIIKLSKEKIRLKQEIKILEEQHINIKSQYEFLQKNVNLEDEMKKVDINLLKNTKDSNQQFSRQIDDLVDNWNSMGKFAKFSNQ